MMNIRKRKETRRGVILLIVLGMLAMFGLIGVTFVLLSGHARRGAQAQAKVGQADNQPQRIADDVIKQILRGSTDSASVIGPHGLLEDLYGNSYAEGAIDTSVIPIADVVTGGQLLSLQTDVADPHKYIGRVLTMTSGRCKGLSTRIVGCDNSTVPPCFQILQSNTTVMPVNGDTFIINGTPFSGTGFGYETPTVADYTGPLLTAPNSDSQQYALLPNPRAFTPTGAYPDPAGPGGANEDYDAADYQNMLLASVVPQSGGSTAIPIPSLHRPSLVNYWFQRLGGSVPMSATWTALQPAQKRAVFMKPYGVDDLLGNGDDWTQAPYNLQPTDISSIVNLKRRIILHPLTFDHPNFSGSNTNFYPIWDGTINQVWIDWNFNNTPDANETFQPQWDIDNDGDGVMDSIWVDVGLPVRTMRDGRQYKPLAAILCVDMDGRLNLNAHGCLAQTNASYIPPQLIAANIVAGSANQLDVPRGQSVGPAEVDLAQLLNRTGLSSLNSAHPDYGPRTQYDVLLRGVANTMAGRYGEGDSVPGRYVNPTTQLPFYDYPPADPLAANKYSDCPGLYDASITYDNAKNSGTMSYGTPVDFTGGACVGLDLRGQPLYVANDPVSGTGQLIGFHPNVGLRADNPYELKLSNVGRGVTRTNAPDTPFTVNELESLLRPYDVDTSMLPKRITDLAPNLADNRHEVTTESWSLPCPAIVMPPELRANAAAAGIYKASSFRDLLAAKGVPDAQMRTLVGPELLSGLKLNLNRPLGNGIDDNDNGVIDEPTNGIDDDGINGIDDPGEGEETEPFYQVDSTGVALATPPSQCDLSRSASATGAVNPIDQSRARQLYARHLYVTMLLLMNHDGADQDVAREVAQWAVNIVDFRDRDSIMTGFEYDVNPFNGWDVDSDLTTDDDGDATNPPNIVWGCERPEMLITETLAFHDRRTEDFSVGNGKVGSVAPNTDDDFDQRVRPRGSLFVELYNPWTDNESLPGELYRTVGAHTGIDLRAMAADGDSPVWRMIIVENTHAEDPDDLDLPVSWEIERSVYFVEPGPIFAGAVTDDGERYYPESGNEPAISVLKPGRYAVVGPGTGNGTDTTYVGFREGAPLTMPVENYNDNNTRRIELTPAADPDTPQVAVFGDGAANDLESLNIQAAIAVVINPEEFAVNQPKRLSVSEPTDGYPAYIGNMYAPIRDAPLDNDPLDRDRTAKMADGTTSQYRWLYLQRLANPLEAYHEETNPYRTIDKAQIDLTAFNGIADDSIDPLVIAATKTTPDLAFFTRERGEDEENPAGAAGQPHNIWAVELATAAPKANVPNTDTNKQAPVQLHYFGADFAHTLGYLNEGFGVPQSVPTNTDYDGSPQQPFPWLTWLNRPFLSEMEMMLAPKKRSSQLLASFSMTGGDPYTDSSQPHGHVINFFYDDKAVGDDPNWKLHRLLEFVRVPSPFVGTQLQGEPATFSTGTHDFHPPFNRISNRRDPGRVNLNTITSQQVWNGLRGDFPNPAWTDIVASRKGDSNGMFALNNDLPTRFANPFRSFAGMYNVPEIPALQTIVDSEVKATLLRTEPGGNNPLFRHDQTASPVNNTNRNPYFRYQLLNRLGSTATTRSNVYAVWITVGYFEVTPATPWPSDPIGFAKVYPDGFQLGQELGADTGDITRHRAFYMIDRSIPVGFQRGEDLNSENAILLRRFIE